MAHLAQYKEAHPTIFVVTHWINLICMFGLILTGFMIHFPSADFIMGVARGAHMAFAFVILINLVVRLILSFRIKTAQFGGTREGMDYDWKNFFPSKVNKHQFGPWIKYYLFGKKTHPVGSKYGSPQKIAYFIIPFLLLGSALTGFCMWGPTSDWGLFSGITAAVGGLMNVRIIHYFLMWIFIIFIIIHVYLATIEGSAYSKIMFLHKESPGYTIDPETVKVNGHDDLKGNVVNFDDEGVEFPSDDIK